MPWYFAYGSNMNLARVEARIGDTRRVLPATLEGYALRFNKASKVPGIAHANVVPAAGERVEGALFELMVPEQIA
ncbi:MAG: gamma-glutamylcyclotransferase family protein, partial [Pseudomonadota bacterium]|nr:gamma-glutamylcyclotransferase family protein [Pseudomonadota bacterium]